MREARRHQRGGGRGKILKAVRAAESNWAHAGELFEALFKARTLKERAGAMLLGKLVHVLIVAHTSKR